MLTVLQNLGCDPPPLSEKKKKTNNQTYVHFYISRRLTKKQLLLVLKIVSLRQLMDQESPSPLNILHALALCNKSKKGYTIMQP